MKILTPPKIYHCLVGSDTFPGEITQLSVLEEIPPAPDPLYPLFLITLRQAIKKSPAWEPYCPQGSSCSL